MTPRSRSMLVLVLAAACSLLAAACAGSESEPSTQESYASTIRTEHANLDEAMSRAFGGEALEATGVEQAVQQAERSLDALESVDVPERHADAHAAYVSGLEAFADILADVRDGIDDPNAARRHLEDERFGAAVADLERATNLYRENGLDLDEDEANG